MSLLAREGQRSYKHGQCKQAGAQGHRDKGMAEGPEDEERSLGPLISVAAQAQEEEAQSQSLACWPGGWGQVGAL